MWIYNKKRNEKTLWGNHQVNRFEKKVRDSEKFGIFYKFNYI